MKTRNERRTQTLQESIVRRDWFSYMNPVMGIELQIERALIDDVQDALNRLSPDAPVNSLDIPNAIAACARDQLAKLDSIHRQGFREAQIEWLLPQLGGAIHFLSDGKVLYASKTPLLPYSTKM